MLEIKDLSFAYPLENKTLENINLKLEKGFFSLVGASGCGKSTLCLTLNGLIPNEISGKLTGKVLINGMDTQKYQVKNLAVEVGMVFQNPESQLFSLSAEDEISFGPGNLALPWKEIEKRVDEVLGQLNIKHLKNKSPEEMSSGEKQKVAIASALAMNPKILVLDEPTANLDPKSSEEIFRIIKDLSKDRLIFLTEHDIDRVIRYSDEIAVMNKGKIVMFGKPKEILNRKELFEYIYPPKISRLAWQLDIKPIPVAAEDLAGKIKLKRKLKTEDQTKKEKLIIEIEKLFFGYEKDNFVLKNINLTVREGEFLAIVGENGAGKSTLGLHLNGLLKPTKGTVLISGIDTMKAKVSRLAKEAGYVFQNPDLQMFEDNLIEEISFGPKNLGVDKDQILKRTDEILERAGLEQYKEKDPFSLSVGQKRRVSIASILTMKPRIIVLDEPSTGLDGKTLESLMSLVERLNEEGHTIIMITHDMELVADYADRVAVMKNGEIIADNSTRNIFADEKILKRANLIRPEINKLGRLIGEPKMLKLDEVTECVI